jgi:hypothetical protein
MLAFPRARPIRPKVRTATVVSLLGLLAIAYACGRAPAPSQPDEPAAEPPAAEPQETAQAETPAEPPPVEPAPAEPAPVEASPEAAAPPETTPPPDVAPPDPVAVENPVPVEDPQEIVVELDAAQRAALAAQAERDLALAVQVLRDAQLRELSAQEQETLATVEGLVAAARDALAASDVQGAANLANKAKLLAAELTAK